jgi:predicted nucleic acid-binding Zn ribbon protein
MSFEPLKDTLDKTFKRGPIKATVLALTVEKECKKILPKELEAKMISFRQGRLLIATTSSSRAQELYLQSREIAKKINEGLGKKAVEEIRYRIRDTRK